VRISGKLEKEKEETGFRLSGKEKRDTASIGKNPYRKSSGETATPRSRMAE